MGELGWKPAPDGFEVPRGSTGRPAGLLPFLDDRVVVLRSGGARSGAGRRRLAVHGTRIPIAALFQNLDDGMPVGQFVEWFPGVTLEHARAVLEHAARSTLIPV